MNPFQLPEEIQDRSTYDRAVAHLREAGIRLPLLSELTNAPQALNDVYEKLNQVHADAPDPRNLYRVHWFNDRARTGLTDTPEFVRLPKALTGVDAQIIVALGDRFPMIGAHKVLAAYGCLVPRLVSGAFDPGHHRAVWPSTGNYCRGGIAISRILGCHGVAVLPEGMSRERFSWLEKWVSDPQDIVRTPGTESNVKEIYDKCEQLSRDPQNIIVNQFSEFSNYLVHRLVTGNALDRIFQSVSTSLPNARLAGFIAATGSAGTLGAGDHLKSRYGTRIVAVEPVECPTLLYNGFGEHNIQGVGDKHVPLIHNVMNTDFVVGVSDYDSDGINALFNTPAGRNYLHQRKGISAEILDALTSLGFSGIANVLAAIKLAKYLSLGPEDVLITVATDGSALYQTELQKWLSLEAPEGVDETLSAELYGAHLKNVRVDHLLELTEIDRNRIFNLGYYTWVEQQGINIQDFERRRHQTFWNQLERLIPTWDAMIEAFNQETAQSRNA
ncbi:MAG: pyridoxal-phosphate dependent enzyme [Arenicellales bacterium]|jgi:cysteine synthase|nr:pyridoxal-phosphate dependent enzyme [Arenicellales bacterium]MDP7450632.1 pyridoxal-phosphate dependent enzyme [Arenicellales bacterium]MDP7616078.1 pyridoxal-phosphate dependent enzyme [Arenicellales bacterium]|tara:strand:+ start:1578 stop:3077 length:1500 start_codon:yes stop_codon:yes gene_type:complete